MASYIASEEKNGTWVLHINNEKWEFLSYENLEEYCKYFGIEFIALNKFGEWVK